MEKMTELPDITTRILDAMEEESIAKKNITLFEALRTIERLRHKYEPQPQQDIHHDAEQRPRRPA